MAVAEAAAPAGQGVREKRPARAGGANGDELLLAAVTAVLKHLLENGLVDRGVTAHLGGDATISALPPDRITTGEEEKAQLNLFLYQVSLKGLSARSRYEDAGDGDSAGRRPGVPLGLDLHYLLTAYGAQDFQTEVLLGYAMALFHETGALTAEEICRILASVSATDGGRVVLPALAALASSGLVERMQQIKISPQVLNPEEMSRLWSSLQARFRPSAVYKVSVSLVEETGAPSGEEA